MKIVVKHLPDKNKSYLALEDGKRGITLAAFHNEEMERLYEYVLGERISGERRKCIGIALPEFDGMTIDDILEQMRQENFT